MKKLFILLLLSLFYSLGTAHAVHSTPNKSVQATDSSPTLSEKEVQKKAKKEARREKRFNKIKEKLAKRGYAVNSSIWDDDTFRLGALIALGGLLIRLIGILPIPLIGGVLRFLGVLMLLVGVGVMIWVMIERS